MAVECERCGKKARTVRPYLRKPPTAATAVCNPRPLSRNALWVLNPSLEASIPWGQHPDDDMFGVICEDCANEVTVGG